MNILKNIQQNLNCPKNLYNKFGNYNYRSAETILESVKPLLGDSILTISDEVVMVGDRIYVKSTAKLIDGDKEYIVSAYAREAEEQKGMSPAQITGSTSSYARKYALNGLFAIDDTKDDDTKDNTKNEEKPAKTQINDSQTPIEVFKASMTYENYLKLGEADKKRVELALCKKADVPFMSSEEIKQYLTIKK